MSESTYSLFQKGKAHLKRGMPAQATVALEKAKKREPDKASIREALGIAYFRIRRWDAAENAVTLITQGAERAVPKAPKDEIAASVLDALESLLG